MVESILKINIVIGLLHVGHWNGIAVVIQHFRRWREGDVVYIINECTWVLSW